MLESLLKVFQQITNSPPPTTEPSCSDCPSGLVFFGVVQVVLKYWCLVCLAMSVSNYLCREGEAERYVQGLVPVYESPGLYHVGFIAGKGLLPGARDLVNCGKAKICSDMGWDSQAVKSVCHLWVKAEGYLPKRQFLQAVWRLSEKGEDNTVGAAALLVLAVENRQGGGLPPPGTHLDMEQAFSQQQKRYSPKSPPTWSSATCALSTACVFTV